MIKHKRLFLIMLSMMISTSHAATSTPRSKCDIPGEPENAVAQCLYLTGLNDNDQQRWIKTSVPGAFSIVSCTGSIEQTNRYTIMEKYYPVETTIPSHFFFVSICTDETGTNCQQISSYKFSCTADGGQGHCDPVDMPVDISSVKNKFPACNEESIPPKMVLPQ